MSECIMKFTLRQDSPMIHFQGSTKGATLRASEVKPKLDRFLAEWCKKNEIEEENKWKIDQDRNAYDYKMRIYAGNEKKVVLDRRGKPDKLPSYFGDLDEQKTNLWYTDGIRLEILCFHKGLRKVINEAIETFFVLHNFGTRQNRGIGGFTLRRTTPEDAERILVDWYRYIENINNIRITVYKMVFLERTSAESILKCGNMFYQILKSGINHGGTYIKSYLTLYFLNRKVKGTPQLIGGEKRWMKQQRIAPGIAPPIGRTLHEPNNSIAVNDFRFIRGLLGTSDSIKYQDGSGGLETILIRSDELERVPSPIRYKLVNNVLFLIPLIPGKDIYGKGNTICGKKFTFENEVRHTGKKELFIPYQNTEFTMQGLMDGYIRYLNGTARSDVEKYARDNGIIRPKEGIAHTWIRRCR